MKKNPVFMGQGGISAAVIAHSLHPADGCRPIVTIQLRYPRFIHAELMTHRVFSRNASSSRAIPVAKMLEQVRTDPAMPIHWGKNQPGMQAAVECDELILVPDVLADAYGRFCNNDGAFPVPQKTTREMWWRFLGWLQAHGAEAFSEAGYHKQVVNRRLEADQFISVIVTATEWNNFFELRDHPDAQPEIRELARVMKRAMQASRPVRLNYGEWHLPYVMPAEIKEYGYQVCRRLSAARCARVSYLTHDGQNPNVEKDFELFDRLVGGVPLHASPIEHQASPDPIWQWPAEVNTSKWGNFVHWVQFRKLHEEAVANGTYKAKQGE